METSKRTLISLFTPGSVHSGSASWDNFGRVFPDELRLSSFLVGSHTMAGQHSQPTPTHVHSLAWLLTRIVLLEQSLIKWQWSRFSHRLSKTLLVVRCGWKIWRPNLKSYIIVFLERTPKTEILMTKCVILSMHKTWSKVKHDRMTSQVKRIYSKTPVGVHESYNTINIRFPHRQNTVTTKASTTSRTNGRHREKENINTENRKYDNLG